MESISRTGEKTQSCYSITLCILLVPTCRFSDEVNAKNQKFGEKLKNVQEQFFFVIFE